MLAYAFDADTTEWSVLSYEDAVAGIITSRRTGEKLRPIAQGEPYEIDGNENWLAMQLNGPGFSSWPWTSRIGFTDSPSRPSGRIFRRCT